MDMIAYIPFAILGGVIAVMLLVLYLIQKKDHRDLQEYLHRWQIESDKNDKNFQRLQEYALDILRDVQKTNKDNALYLRMIFERVDKPQPE